MWPGPPLSRFLKTVCALISRSKSGNTSNVDQYAISSGVLRLGNWIDRLPLLRHDLKIVRSKPEPIALPSVPDTGTRSDATRLDDLAVVELYGGVDSFCAATVNLKKNVRKLNRVRFVFDIALRSNGPDPKETRALAPSFYDLGPDALVKKPELILAD